MHTIPQMNTQTQMLQQPQQPLQPLQPQPLQPQTLQPQTLQQLSLTEIAQRVSQCSASQQVKLAAILKHNETTICPTNDYVMINLSAAPEKAIRLASEYLQNLPPDAPEIPVDDLSISSTTIAETYRRPGIQKRIAGNHK